MNVGGFTAKPVWIYILPTPTTALNAGNMSKAFQMQEVSVTIGYVAIADRNGTFFLSLFDHFVHYCNSTGKQLRKLKII